MARRLLAHGVTAFLPTVITSSIDAYRAILPELVPTSGSRDGAAVLMPTLPAAYDEKVPVVGELLGESQCLVIGADASRAYSEPHEDPPHPHCSRKFVTAAHSSCD